MKNLRKQQKHKHNHKQTKCDNTQKSKWSLTYMLLFSFNFVWMLFRYNYICKISLDTPLLVTTKSTVLHFYLKHCVVCDSETRLEY